MPQRSLPLEKVRKFLESINFQPQATLSEAPTWVIKGKYPRYATEVVIKVATTPRDSMRLRNHIVWTKSLAKKVPQDANFHHANVLEDGQEGTLQWCMMTYVRGTPLAKVRGKGTEINTPLMEKSLPGIVALLRFIERNSAISIAGLDARFGGISKKDKLSLLQTAIEWARPDTPYLAELLQIISANYQYLGIANSHGDFTETNIIINAKNQPVLIDADISDAFNYRYYDMAEFYNRLYTRACSPGLARTFLVAYLNSQPKQSINKLLNNFLCLSALRCIGNFMEIASLKEEEGIQQRLEFAQKYAEDIVSRKILLLQ